MMKKSFLKIKGKVEEFWKLSRENFMLINIIFTDFIFLGDDNEENLRLVRKSLTLFED